MGACPWPLLVPASLTGIFTASLSRKGMAVGTHSKSWTNTPTYMDATPTSPSHTKTQVTDLKQLSIRKSTVQGRLDQMKACSTKGITNQSSSGGAYKDKTHWERRELSSLMFGCKDKGISTTVDIWSAGSARA